MENESRVIIEQDQPVTMGQLLQLFQQFNPNKQPTEFITNITSGNKEREETNPISSTQKETRRLGFCEAPNQREWYPLNKEKHVF